jgi:hypothetical protein
VTAAAVALLGAAGADVLLVDLTGEQPDLLGLGSVDDPDLGDWLTHTGAPPPDALARLERPVTAGLRLLTTGADGVPCSEVGRPRLELLARLLADDHRLVVVDLGRWQDRWYPLHQAAGKRILVTRACYLALRRASAGPVPTGAVLVQEPGRALGRGDVSEVIGAPVLAVVPVDPVVARVVDAGLLASRLPRPLRRLEVLVPSGVSS